jgi:hypothetical protein
VTRRGGPALLALALVGAAAVAAAPDETTGAGRPIEIQFDDQVVERFLTFVERGDATPEDLRRWVRLPGNVELLRQGRLEGGLTPDLLEEAARVGVRGAPFPGPPTLGVFPAWTPEELRALLEAVRGREPEMAAGAGAAVRPYLPAGAPLPPLVVRFHLGGSWDGRTTDAIYINLALYKERGLQNVSGLDALLVHEMFHRAQGALLPSVEDWSSRQSALYTVLLRVQQEGIARHIEYGWLKAREVPGVLDNSHLILYADGLRRAPEHAKVLAEIVSALDAADRERARRLAAEGFRSGGPLYAVGHAMAAAIEERSGRPALAATVGTGPLAFLRAYETAIDADGAAAAGGTLLPAALPDRLRDLESGYGRDPLLASRARRDGLRLLAESKNGEAKEALHLAVKMDPSDASSAYNLACAEALEGRERRAMKWLVEAFARGFDDTKHAAADDDLTVLRQRRDFKQLLAAHAPSGQAAPPAGEQEP